MHFLVSIIVTQGEELKKSCHLVKIRDDSFSVPQGEELRRSCYFVKTEGIFISCKARLHKGRPKESPSRVRQGCIKV